MSIRGRIAWRLAPHEVRLRAAHEAGHALAYVRLGLPFTEVAINPVVRKNGERVSAGGLIVSPLRVLLSQGEHESAIVATLSGATAEEALVGEGDPRRWEGDARSAIEQAHRALGLPDSDEPPSLVVALLTRLSRKAENLISSERRLLRELAGDLAGHPRGTLSEKEVRAIVRGRS